MSRTETLEDTITEAPRRGRRKNRSKRALSGPSTTAVLYARVSSKEQEEGFSIEAQLGLLRAHALKEGLSVAQEFVDVETARKTGRTNFGRMIRFIRSSLSPVTILVEKTDRIYRNLKDYTVLDDLIRDKDTRVVLVKENERLGRDASSHTKFIHGIKVLMAKNYVDNLSEEVIKGQMKKAESGQYPSIPPVGYLWDRGKRSLVHVPEATPHIRKIFERYATGLYSLARVADMASEDGFLTKTRRPVSKHGVEEMIKNPIYYGDFYWRGKLYKGSFEGIVSKHLWDEANRQLRRTGRPETYHKNDLPYRGLVRCAKCSGAVTAQIQKKRYVYHHCSQPVGRCERTYVRKEDLERQLFEGIEKIHVPDDMALVLQSILDEVDKERCVHARDSLHRLESKRAELRSRLDRLYSDHSSGKIDEEFFTGKWNAWRAELSQIESDLSRAAGKGTEARKHFENVIELCNKAKSLFESGDERFRARLADITLSNLELDGKTLRYDYRFPFNLMVETQGGSGWRAARDANRTLLTIPLWKPEPKDILLRELLAA